TAARSCVTTSTSSAATCSARSVATTAAWDARSIRMRCCARGSAGSRCRNRWPKAHRSAPRSASPDAARRPKRKCYKRGHLPRLRMAPMNLASSLQQWAARAPSKPAILFEGRTISYAQLEADASRLANAMRANGIGAGDRVALYLPNIPEFATTYYAAQKIGAIPVSINAIFRTGEVEYLLNDSGAVLVFTVAELVPFVPRASCPAL